MHQPFSLRFARAMGVCPASHVSTEEVSHRFPACVHSNVPPQTVENIFDFSFELRNGQAGLKLTVRGISRDSLLCVYVTAAKR